MKTETVYRGYTIVPLCSSAQPYVAGFQVTPPFENEPICGTCLGTFASEEEGYRAALELGKAKVDELLA